MTESDREAFERAILAAPEDDAPRLIYADWLDEHGDAEFACALRDKTRSKRVKQYADLGKMKNVVRVTSSLRGLMVKGEYRFDHSFGIPDPVGDLDVETGTASPDQLSPPRASR